VPGRIAAVCFLALVAATGRASAEPPCIPLARVSGDPVLVATVTRVLYERGLSSSGTSACGTVSAEVVPRDERVWIRLTDADGRTVERVADDGEGAATTIESWTRQDVVDPLLAVRATAPVVNVSAVRPRRPAARSTQVVAPAGPPGWELSALGVAAVSDDGALWSGARAQFSARVAVLSIGGRVGVALDTGAAGVTSAGCVRRGTGDFAYRDAEAGCDTSRVALDLVLVGEVPFSLGRLALTPGLRTGAADPVGLARIRRRRRAAGRRERAPPEAHLGVSLPLARAWSMRFDMTGSACPTARRWLGATDAPSDPEYVPSLAGTPAAQGSIGIGLAYAPPGAGS
jgi:hypothetical protein